MQIFDIPAFLEANSKISIMVAGITHLIQCKSLTWRVWKSDLAAEDIQSTRRDILTAERSGSAMFTGNGTLPSRLLRYRYTPDWNRPTD